MIINKICFFVEYLKGFPIRVWKRYGCTRLATDFVYRAKGEKPLILDASVDEVRAVIDQWIKDQPSTTVFVSHRDYIFMNCLTFFMGFPDNVAIRIKEISKKQTGVEIQAESIIGGGDLNVNLKRVQNFVKFVNQRISKQK